MKAMYSLAFSLFVLLPALADAAGTTSTATPRPDIARYDAGLVQHGGSPGGFAKAFSDSFNIYGGVRRDGTNDRRPEGLFQNEFLFPLDQGWFGVDLTQNPTFWHISTFNAANLDVPVGNRAMWSGVDGGASGYTTAPGYGNGWDDRLEWRGQANPVIITNARLRFDYNYDVEPGYDFFSVDYDSAGTWINMVTVTGSNKDTSGSFSTKATFDQTVQYTPFMLTGSPKRDIHFRMRVKTDGAWSDEDGLWPTKGAAQVDNIRVDFNGSPVTEFGDGNATFADLGGGVDDNEGWMPIGADFVGDFAKVLPQLRDLDPCRSNLSPQLGFVDDGSAPNNAPGQTTGGQTSVNWSYGVLGGWVVNYNGGLSFGASALANEWWSPEIDWNDPNSVEDDLLEGGAFIRYSVWQHLPLLNGMFWTWSVRSHDGVEWSPWQNRGFVYYGDSGGTYVNAQNDVSDLMLLSPTKVQIAFGAADLAGVFAFPGTDSTPSPSFDNASFWRYDLGGPAFSTRNIDLFNDSFPQSGTMDPLGSPATMNVRLDMARDISTGVANVPGDSVICDIVPTIPGSALAGLPTMEWVLESNPLFDAVRSVPPGAVNVGPNGDGWDVWTGSATGDSSRTSGGAVIADRYFFDNPGNESDFFFPGDVFRYYLSAADDLGNTTTLPGNIGGFLSGDNYSRTFTVRALPNVRSDGGGGTTQPEILFINDFGHRGGEATMLSAFAQNGMFEGEDFDVYTVMGPSSLVSNGIGSAGAHGATADQLSGYNCLFYESGNLSSGLLSDGSNVSGNDKGDDVGVLLSWHGQEANRYMVHFGDNLASFLEGGGSSSLTYLTTIMGVNVGDHDVRDEIGNQAAALVQPTGAIPALSTDFIAFGGCLSINQFDSITPLPGAIASHEFTDGQGGSYPPAASVWYARTQQIGENVYDRIDVSFPYGFVYVNNATLKVGESSRSVLVAEILGAFGHSTNPGAVTPADLPQLPMALSQNHPNPFNPSTEIRFALPRTGPVSLRIYNVRGELVRTLVDGVMEAGPQSVQWDGRDEAGTAASSGVYLYKLSADDRTLSRKMMLIK